jgi:molybdate transport system permease protein
LGFYHLKVFKMDWTALRVTGQLALATTMTLFIFGLPLAYWLATTKKTWRFLVEALVTMPIVLPPTVIGFYILVASGPQSGVGKQFADTFGFSLPFSFPGILLGSILYNVPFAVRPFTVAFAAIDPRLVEASWCVGGSKINTFFQVIFPLAWPGILSGLILTFAHTVGEFGVVMMIGGNIPGVTRTIAISLYDDVESLNYQAASTTAWCLLGFAFIVVCVTSALQRRTTSMMTR